MVCFLLVGTAKDLKKFGVYLENVRFKTLFLLGLGVFIYLNADLETSGINLHNQSACWNRMLVHPVNFESFPLRSIYCNLSIIDQRTLLFDNIQINVDISVISET